ncbi:Rep2p (plasmid) [Saccharomyces cerevisiae YJM428]|nr:Rep2p [Saccharomyces cerevisiae YJM428]AKA09959.1 Rep2p [Saccharomyces cerevisiae YJM456]AKA10023.1 Rep2p [Saccharomyces cerevisiae YJM1083]AKA10135.1 Rep2p [Saccharomyces cerevisiae YJM1433]AKA10139.1 Rep2p [Saccharomyces cerevisiae YJM1450]
MDDIETAKNLTVKARTAYSVWDVCRLFIEMIAPDVDIDIESKRKSDELLFPGYVIRPMESLTTGRPYGLDSSAEDSSVSSDSSAEVILPAAKMVKERFDSIGNGMLSSQEASQAAIDLMLQNNKLLDNRKQLYKSIAIIIGRLPEKDKKRATEMLMRKMDCTQLLVPPAPTEEDVMKLVSVVTQLLTLVPPDRQAALIGDLFIPESLKDIFNSFNELAAENRLQQKKSELEGRTEVNHANANEEVPSRRTRSRDTNARGAYKLQNTITEGPKAVPTKKRRVATRVRGRKSRNTSRV